MADKKNNTIDPIYQKFVLGIIRSIGSSEFYDFFMNSISRADNTFQFSNRKMIKKIDLTWIDAIEESLDAFQKIIYSPRNVIKEEDLIVDVANARKSGSESLRHLAQHSSLIESFNEDTGDVRPNKIMQRYREETIGIYENRLVFTVLENALNFVKIRHDALVSAMSDEFGAKLKVNSNMITATEELHYDMFLHVKQIDGALKTDDKNAEAFARISRIYRVLSSYMNTDFARQLSKLSRAKGAIHQTNILKRNKSYKQIIELLGFLRNYDEVGYLISVVEQNPTIDEQFQEDIYRNIMFNYLILKGYLQDEEDRQIPVKAKGRKKSLKPKFIKEIIEELVQDYDLPDVEIRKVLIEQLTKEQLMKEEQAERRRLVEEAKMAAKKAKEEEKAKQDALKAKLKEEKEAERLRKQREKEALIAQENKKKTEQKIEDNRIKRNLRLEFEYFQNKFEDKLRKRGKEKERLEKIQLDDYADAVVVLQEVEARKALEKQQARLEKIEAKKREEYERQQELIRQQKEQQLIQERLQKEKEEEEYRKLQLQIKKDLVDYAPIFNEIKFFKDNINDRLALRKR